jgi:uncharacterized protein YkwD
MRAWTVAFTSLSLCLVACSSDDGTTGGASNNNMAGSGAGLSNGVGGSTESGGTTGSTGAAPGTGGVPGNGGTLGAGGDVIGSGGDVIGSGGAVATGGTVSTGGVATGGTVSTGGTVATGGTNGTGGTSSDVPNIPECADYADWDEDDRALEEGVLALVNQYRQEGRDCAVAKNAVATLEMDPLLRCAARMHAQDMADRSFFSHGTWDDAAQTCTVQDDCGQNNGKLCDNKIGDETPTRCLNGPGVRLDSLDYDGTTWGENIYGGNSTALGVMTGWMNSSGHCNNIMNGNFKKIGVAHVAGGPYGYMWVQVFGN